MNGHELNPLNCTLILFNLNFTLKWLLLLCPLNLGVLKHITSGYSKVSNCKFLLVSVVNGILAYGNHGNCYFPFPMATLTSRIHINMNSCLPSSGNQGREKWKHLEVVTSRFPRSRSDMTSWRTHTRMRNWTAVLNSRCCVLSLCCYSNATRDLNDENSRVMVSPCAMWCSLWFRRRIVGDTAVHTSPRLDHRTVHTGWTSCAAHSL